MHHGDDESRRGQKRPASARDDQSGMESADVRIGAPPTAEPEARDFSQPTKEFDTKSFLPCEVKASSFKQPKSGFPVDDFASTSTGFIGASKKASQRKVSFTEAKHEFPVVSYGTPSLEIQSEQTTEHYREGIKPIETALAPESISALKDPHDAFSTLFPSYREYLSSGFSGIGDGGSPHVQIHTKDFHSDLFSKPACFLQPEDNPDDGSESVDMEVGSDRVYPGSRISIHDSVMSILTFAHTEKLTGAALRRLLSLIDIHCPAKNNLVKSTDKLFEHLDYLNSPFEMSYYCNICWRARVSSEDLCDKCKDPKRKVHFFVHFSLAEQLKNLFKRPQFIEAIKYPQNRCKENDNAIEDIIDGELYQEALKNFLSDSNNLSLMWYTDGVQLFESTNYSIWPQFFVILELPPDQRYKPENMLLGGLWGSGDHPHPNIVLKHTVNELLVLREKGVEVQPPNGEMKVVKVCCLCGTCDTPAKASFMNLKGHAGYYACPVCFNKGLKSEESEKVMVFPHENLVELRSVHAGYSNLVHNSFKKYKDQNAKDVACKGVQGPTLLSLMFHFCMYKSVGIDSMHCLFGLVKQFCHMWFDVKFHKEPFSLYEKLDEVNTLLSNIQLPQFVQRLPLAVDKLSFWKASLCFNFFFHMMLPVLKTVMIQKYFEHLVLLVDSVALLNSSSVSLADIDKADIMLCKFAEDFSKFYNVRQMSLNLHLTRHLSTVVKNLGPLWATSCFPFEDFNGKLISLAHGTKDSLIQISRRFPILTGLSTEIENMSEGPSKEFCEQLMQKWKRYHIKEKISDQSLVVGYFDQTVLYRSEINELLQAQFQIVPKFHSFSKLYHNKQLFVASSYKRSERKSSAVKYSLSDGEKYGELLTFVKVENVNYFAYIQRFTAVPFVPTCPEQLSYLLKVTDVACHDLVPIRSLKAVCFHISIHDTTYISNVLNRFERF